MKTIYLVICSVILALVLAACGSSGNSGQTTAGNASTGNSEIQTTAASNDQKETAGGETQPAGGQETEEETKEEPGLDIDGELIVDEAGVKVFCHGISEDDFWGAVVNLTLVNNSGQSLTFQPRKTSVNGIMVNPSMSEELEDGETVETTLEFLDDFDLLGIETVKDVEFRLHIYDDDWKAVVDTDPITVTNPDAGSYAQAIDDSGEVAFDEGGIRIVIQGTEDSFWGPQVLVFIENKSGKDITVNAKDTVVNGTAMDPTMYTDVVDGKVAIGTLSFNDLEDDAIETLEVSFHVEEMDAFNDIADSDPIEVSF